MIAAWLLGAAVWAAAGDPPDQPVIPIEGSAWRLGQPHATPDPDLYSLVVLRDRQDCINAVGVDPVDVNACLPWINSATRQIHVAFQMRDGGSHIKPLALSANRFAVSYGARLGPVQVPTSQIQLVPHVPGDSNQLFVLLIDRSASMYEGSDHRPTMERVVEALLAKVTIDAFFPPDVGSRTAVMLFTFSSELQGPSGEAPASVQIMRKADEYRAAVDHLLDVPVSPGWTHLYDSVRAVLDGVLVRPDVVATTRLTNSEPVLIVLTDGFNNVANADTCATNARPLGDLLDALSANQGGVGRRASTYAVGFGEPFRPEYRLPNHPPRQPTADDLCAEHANTVINEGLERRGIDNVSLAFMANAGGGRTYTGTDSRALARFLADTGTRPYSWYEAQIQLGEDEQQRFRTRLPVRFNVRFPRALETWVTFFPNPYFDAPPGHPTESRGGFSGPGTFAEATADLVVGLGATLLMFVLAIGGYHFRRAVLRLARRSPPPLDGGAG